MSKSDSFYVPSKSECDLCCVTSRLPHALHRRLAEIKKTFSPCENAFDSDNLEVEVEVAPIINCEIAAPGIIWIYPIKTKIGHVMINEPEQ